MFYDEKKIEQLKSLYPSGTKICCDNMADDLAPIESGTIGKVDFVDDAGQIHVNWQNGRTLALVPETDSFHVVEQQETAVENLPAVKGLIKKLSDIAEEILEDLGTDIRDFDIDEMFSDEELCSQIVRSVAKMLENSPKVDNVQVSDIGVQFQNFMTVTPTGMDNEQSEVSNETEEPEMSI